MGRHAILATLILAIYLPFQIRANLLVDGCSFVGGNNHNAGDNCDNNNFIVPHNFHAGTIGGDNYRYSGLQMTQSHEIAEILFINRNDETCFNQRTYGNFLVVGNDATDMTANTLCTYELVQGTMDNRYRCNLVSASVVAVVDWDVSGSDTCTDYIVNFAALRVYSQFSQVIYAVCGADFTSPPESDSLGLANSDYCFAADTLM
jgi:hypothetical protein